MIAVLIGAAIATSPHPPVAHLATSEGPRASRIVARQIMEPFTEHRPRVKVASCHRLSRRAIRCHVQAHGDRATLRFRVRVAGRSDGIIRAYASRLQVLA
jgi:hypothetical protein